MKPNHFLLVAILLVGMMFSISGVWGVGTYPNVDSNMVLYYHMNDTGTNVLDYSGNGNNGTANNITHISNGGYLGLGSFYFNGTSYINVTSSTTLNVNNSNRSFCIWVNATSVGTTQFIFSKYNGGSPNVDFYLESDGKFRWYLRNSSSVNNIATSTTVAINNTLNFVCGTFDNTNAIMKIFVNGFEENIKNAGVPTGNFANNDPLYIGKRRDGLNFKGELSDLILWNSVLTNQDIQNIYANYGACINLTKSSGRIMGNTTLCSSNYNVANGIVVINSSNVILDCNYSLLQGNSKTSYGSGSGISIYGGYENVSIKNCIINGFSVGIDTSGVTNNVNFYNNNITNNNIGIRIRGLNNSNFYGNIFTNNSLNGSLGGGVSIASWSSFLTQQSNNNINFFNNTFLSDNNICISLGVDTLNSSTIKVYNNTLRNCNTYGIQTENYAYNHLIANNTILDTGWDGMQIRGGNGTIYGNIINNSGHHGIDFYTVTVPQNNLVKDNIIFRTLNGSENPWGHYIYLYRAVGNRIINNIGYGGTTSTGGAITLAGQLGLESKNNYFLNNSFDNISSSAIFLSNSINNTFLNNTFNNYNTNGSFAFLTFESEVYNTTFIDNKINMITNGRFRGLINKSSVYSWFKSQDTISNTIDLSDISKSLVSYSNGTSIPIYGTSQEINLTLAPNQYVYVYTNTTTICDNNSVCTMNVSGVNQDYNYNEEANKNLTFTDNDENYLSIFYNWLVDGISKLAGYGENVFSYVFNLNVANPSDTVTMSKGIVNGTTMCYQETANISTSCGGLSTGSYATNGTWDLGISMLYDGNFSTYSGAVYNTKSYFFVNYTKPFFSLNNSILKLSTGNRFTIPTPINVTIPTDCWEHDTNKIILMIESIAGVSDEYSTNTFCFNDTWKLIDSKINGGRLYIYEEGMYWNVSSLMEEVTNFTITTNTSNPLVNITYPYNLVNIEGTQSYVNTTLNWTMSDSNLNSCWYNLNGTNISISNCSTNYTNLNYLAKGYYNLILYANDSVGNVNSSRINMSINNQAPRIVLDYPIIVNYAKINDTLQLNLTATDTNLDKLWYNYNGTNVSVTGALSGIANLSNITLSTKKNVTIYANDTAGNLNATTFSWNYKVWENSLIYSNKTIEGYINTITSSYETSIYGIQSAVLNLNGDSYIMEITQAGNILNLTAQVVSPIVDSVTTKSFNITLFYPSENITTENNNIQILPVDIFSCNSTINNTVLNITIRDETTKAILASNNVSANLYWISGTTNLGSYIYNLGNNASYTFCSTQNLTQFSELYLSGNFIYYATNYSTEEYTLDEKQLSSKNISNISLYLLGSSLSTTYLLNVKDSGALNLPGVILRLYRIYQSEANTTLVVEAPLTTSDGTAIVHVVSDSERYNIGIFNKETGTLLQFFDNYIFTCDNPLTSICRQEVKLSIDPRLDVSISQLLDILFYDPVFAEDGTVTITYSIPSGNAVNIKMTIDQLDMFGNSTPCETTVYSAGGTITCNYDTVIEESKIQVKLFKNDLMVMQKGYSISDTPDFGGNNYLIALILLLSMVGMAFTSPEWIVVNAIATFLIAGSLWLLSGMNLVVGLGGLAWLIVAAGILIYKLAEKI